MASRKLNAKQYQAFAESGKSTRVSASTRWLIVCKPPFPIWSTCQGITGDSHMYGSDVKKPGTFAYNCLLARRMAERGVRFIQLYHRGWTSTIICPKRSKSSANDTDQASAALVKDLKQRECSTTHWLFGAASLAGLFTPRENWRRRIMGAIIMADGYSVWMAGRRSQARYQLRHD